MAPKKAAPAAEAPAGATVDEQRAAAESFRLKAAALASGVVTEKPLLATAALPPGKVLVRSNGKDIIKKSSSRKSRYLLIFNCLLAPTAGGRLVRSCREMLAHTHPKLHSFFRADR